MLGARTSRAEGEGELTREGAIAKMLHLLLDWEYPHWMMMAGAILVAVGFIGLVFHRNRNVETDQKKLGANGRSRTYLNLRGTTYRKTRNGTGRFFGVQINTEHGARRYK